MKEKWYNFIEKIMLLFLAANAMQTDWRLALLVYAWLGLWVFSGDAWRSL